MAVIKNNTARLYVINGVALVPGRTVEVALTREDIKDYPNFESAVNAGLIIFEEDNQKTVIVDTGDEVLEVDESQIKGVESFDDMTIAELKQFAKASGIDLGTAVKKAEIIAILENA